MTTTTPERTTLRRDPRAVWAAARGPLAIVAVILVVATTVAAFAPTTNRGLLDPDSTAGYGSRALATLLRERGVQVDLARTSADLRAVDRDSTILVPVSDELTAVQLDALRAGTADLVLVAPNAGQLRDLAPGVEPAGASTATTSLPDCDLPAARAAGEISAATRTYTTGRGVACYRDADAGGAGLVQLETGGRTVTVLGGTATLTNETLAEEGNAALGLNLLGAQPRLVWFRGVPEGVPVDQRRSIGELLPEGWLWATGMLGVAAVLTVGWRARRLGRVVTEPLPVTVRAAETVEGRARLYRRARARGHAADVLRDAVRARLAGLVGTAIRPALVAAVAARTGRPAVEVDGLLYGPAPVDDRAMIDLARALDACEAEVRRS